MDHQEPAVLEEFVPLEQFSNMIRDRGLRSCLVREKKVSCLCGSRDKYTFIDVRDTTYFLMHMIKEWRTRSFPEIVELCRRSPCKRIANLSKRSPFNTIDATQSLRELCPRFAQSARVPVVSKGEIIRILSPIDLMTVLEKSKVAPDVQKVVKLGALQSAVRNVNTLMDSDSLSKAMNLMEKNGISALPIIELKASGLQIRDVISVSDVHRVFELSTLYPGRDFLNEPALSFVEAIRQSLSYPRKTMTFINEREATMKQILKKFSATKSSRIFVIDSRGKPVQMVTQTDVIRLLSEQLGKSNVEELLHEVHLNRFNKKSKGDIWNDKTENAPPDTLRPAPSLDTLDAPPVQATDKDMVRQLDSHSSVNLSHFISTSASAGNQCAKTPNERAFHA